MGSRLIDAATLLMTAAGTMLPVPVATAGEAKNAPAFQLVPSTFADIPGWRGDDHGRAFAAFSISCPAVIAAQTAVGAGRDAGDAQLAAICRQAMARGQRRVGRSEARVFFERFFQPFRIVHEGEGLLTGYYEPHIEGSRVATTRFRIPLYRRPPNLVNVVAETERARSVPLTHMRRTEQGLVPYPTRTEIEAGALAGQGLELIWLADPVDAFFAQVQGSVRVRLTNGSVVGLTYDGKNGHPYSSVGRLLIDRGVIGAQEMSLDRLGAWLRADEARGREAMRHNASFAFFREVGAGAGGSALGALGLPLAVGRSLAVDTSFHRLGLPVFVDAPDLRHWGRRAPFRRLMVAHDVGSAIRGPQRGDIYFGSGDKAGARAGITKHRGTFHVLMPRSDRAMPERRG